MLDRLVPLKPQPIFCIYSFVPLLLFLFMNPKYLQNQGLKRKILLPLNLLCFIIWSLRHFQFPTDSFP
ncbi:hypothetical protein M6B38_287590 [Iris pallida]|uniref:Uncharacterized protein n=1 Tax=Iris pallida TaxID=29817 RepID=A0AAX6HYF0_IRIPA|nr:hypothetical protein M6B38_287590 [Iris pallida]